MKKMRKILLIGLVLGLIGLMLGCAPFSISRMEGSHSINPLSQNQIVIEPGKSVEVNVVSTIASEQEINLFKQYLITTLESKGLHSTSASNTADFKIRVDIVELKRVSWTARFLWGDFAGCGAVEAMVDVSSDKTNTSNFAISAKAPAPSPGWGIGLVGMINRNGTTEMALEEAAKQIAERVSHGP